MLDKNELQQIGTLVREETRKVVQEETRQIVQEETRKIVQEETRNIIREEIASELKPLKQDMKAVKQDIKKIRQDQNSIIKFFDEEYLELRERVEKLEEVVNTLVTH